MTTTLKIEHLQVDNFSVELNTAELKQVIGGNQTLYLQFFIDNQTTIHYEWRGGNLRLRDGGPPDTFIFQARKPVGTVAQQVTPGAAIQIVGP